VETKVVFLFSCVGRGIHMHEAEGELKKEIEKAKRSGWNF